METIKQFLVSMVACMKLDWQQTERRMFGRYNFVANVWFFLSCGYSLRRAINAARNVL